jgi:tripartite-type tricarboxylate transporter receptor subunit TctC
MYTLTPSLAIGRPAAALSPMSVFKTLARARAHAAAPLLALAAAALVPGAATAQAYPSKPVTLVVGFPPGGALDSIGRALADEMGKALGQKVLVDNKPGAGGALAVSAVLNAPSDGHTLLLAAINLATSPALLGVKYDPKTALSMVSQITSVPVFMLASGKSKFSSPADVVRASMATPGGLKIGSGGSGTSGHLALELFARSVGMPVLHIPYKGGSAANMDLISGEVDVIFDLGSAALKGFLDSGAIKPLAVMQDSRSQALPSARSAKELGLPAETFIRSWQGVAVKANTPPAVVARLHQAVVAAAQTPAFKRRATQLAADVVTSASPADFQAFHNAELDRWTRLIKTAGIKAQ